MKRSVLTRLAAAGLVVGLLGVAVYYFYWDPTPSYESVADDAVPQVDRNDLEAVARQRIFFGHMSVGKNIMSGLDQVYAAQDVAPPAVVEVSPGVAVTLPDGGVLAHALIGENRHPLRKLANFDSTLRGGLAEQVDTAALKFCYVDVGWTSDVDGLFATYRDTLARLQADYPDVRFVHMTVPLTTGPDGIKDRLKVLAGRDDNAARERYNALMRDAYGPDELFDLATLEATRPDDILSEGALFEGYSSDGAHLNAAGSARIAAELIGFLADSRR